MAKIKLKKNDEVVVISGSDSGKRGKILLVDTQKDRVVVEGVNKKKKFLRPSQEHPKGGVLQIEYPVKTSNVMFFCDKCKKGVRVGVEVKDNQRHRVCKKCGKSL